MSESKHTPGPWVVDGRMVEAFDEDGRGIFACEVYGPTEEAPANAALIASAPDMAATIATLRAEVAELTREQDEALTHNESLRKLRDKYQVRAVEFRDERDEARAQRDGLLEAAELVDEDSWVRGSGATCTSACALADLRTAIAAARQGEEVKS